jgi:AraC-like DNA-binding protein
MELVRVNSEPIASFTPRESVSKQPCYSVRMVQAFIRLLRSYEGFPPRVLGELEKLDVDGRVPVTCVHELLQDAIAFTKYPDIGLEAARESSSGELGAFDYAISTAATVGEAIDTAARYRRLINDTICFQLRVERERAVLQIESSVVMPRAAVDFQLAVLYRNHLSHWPRTADAGYEVWFTHNQPNSNFAYRLSFPGVTLRFSMPFAGFVLLESDLAKPLRTADRNLHALVCKSADQILAMLPKTDRMIEKVRELIITDISTGGPYAERVSRALDISSRTLLRKLDEEGITFKDLLDDVRRRLALSYVDNRDIGLADVAFLLGFSHVSAFNRAFRRWTSQTPLEYRRSRRRDDVQIAPNTGYARNAGEAYTTYS